MQPTPVPPDRWWQSAGYGASAGFATTVANAAGPVMNLYLLARRLPKHEFVATGAWFFFVVNLVKLPIYAGHGLIDRRSLLFDLALAPSVVGGRVARARGAAAHAAGGVRSVGDGADRLRGRAAARAALIAPGLPLPRRDPVLACARTRKTTQESPWQTRRRF